jgi:hypothetical protein
MGRRTSAGLILLRQSCDLVGVENAIGLDHGNTASDGFAFGVFCLGLLEIEVHDLDGFRALAHLRTEFFRLLVGHPAARGEAAFLRFHPRGRQARSAGMAPRSAPQIDEAGQSGSDMSSWSRIFAAAVSNAFRGNSSRGRRSSKAWPPAPWTKPLQPSSSTIACIPVVDRGVHSDLKSDMDWSGIAASTCRPAAKGRGEGMCQTAGDQRQRPNNIGYPVSEFTSTKTLDDNIIIVDCLFAFFRSISS